MYFAERSLDLLLALVQITDGFPSEYKDLNRMKSLTLCILIVIR